jgi:ABC-type multidrug transport system fused ATPase/permease subunit
MNFKLILTLLTKREKKQLIIIILAMLLMGFIELVGIGSIGPFISIIANPEIIHTNEYLQLAYEYLNFTSDNSFIICLGIGVILFIAFSNLCLAVDSYIIYVYSGKRKHSIALRLFEKYLRQPYMFYLNANSAVLTKNIINDVVDFVNLVLICFLQLISCSIVSLFIIVLLILINPLLAILVSLILSFFYVIIFTFVRKYMAKKGNEREFNNVLRFKYLNETFGGIKDIKILGKERIFLNLFSIATDRYAMNDALNQFVSDLPKFLIETIAIGGIVALLTVTISLGSTVDEFLPILAVYTFGAFRLLPLLQKVFRSVQSIRYTFPIVENLNNDFNTIPDGSSLEDSDIPPMEFKNNIQLTDIEFHYPGNEKNILNGQTLCIHSNTSVAIVGPTGCGKTTLVDIILGLLEPQNGKIFIDNTEISADNIKSWQKNFGYVPQSIYLSDDTIRHNIAFGIPAENIDDQAVQKAAKIANIHEFIEKELVSGYDTVIGERGIRLSGGQRQRIGIARALYHDPQVLILDEATSALDSLTENVIIEAIDNLNHQKTIIMIAHRITTVKSCDMIYMMEDGKIVDSGTYEELYEKNKIFRKMASGT